MPVSIEKIKLRQRKYVLSPKGRVTGKRAVQKYQKSEKGRAAFMRAMRKFHKSEKGMIVTARYQNSEKGRVARRRAGRKYAAKNRALARNVTVGDLTEIAKIYERAQWWKQWFKVMVDHIIPLSKGGTHEPSNLQIIYGFENCRKHAKLDYKPSVVFL